MLPEIVLIYLATIGGARLLSQFRDFLPQAVTPHAAVALLLLAVPLIHRWAKKISLPFFENDFRSLIKSLRLFSVAALLIFPPFLLGNHLYQKMFFSFTLHSNAISNFNELLFFQLFLVALPEEIFFRGWLQGNLRKHWGAMKAIAVTSLLFALAHSLIALEWWHFAIFFPGLVFGFLREKTGAITASILFHAVSNILVAWIGISYY